MKNVTPLSRPAWLGAALPLALALAAGCSDDPAPYTPPGMTGAPPQTTTDPAATSAATTATSTGAVGETPATSGVPGGPGTGNTAAPTGASTTGAVGGGELGGVAGGATGQTPTTSGGAPGDGGATTPTTGDVPTGGTSAVNEWPMMGYDLASTYHNPAETTITKENAGSLEVAWRATMGDNVYGAPLQIGDVIYASSGAVVQALDAATGDRIWRNTRAGTTGSMAYDEGTLYLHTVRGQLVALDAATGDQKFSEDAGPSASDGSSSPIVAGNVVLVGGSSGAREYAGGSFRGWLGATDKNTGSSAWATYTVPERSYGASIWSTVSVDLAANRVFAGTGNNHGPPATDSSDAFVAFDLTSGMILWKNQRTENDTFTIASRQAVDYDFGGNPVLYTANVAGTPTELAAAGQKSGEAHAVRRDDGMLVWTRPLCPGSSNGLEGIFVNGAYSGKHLLFACNGSEKSELFALDGATGNVLWQTPLMGGEVWGRISTVPGVGFVGAGPELVIFDSDTGAILKTIPSVRGSVTGTVSIAHGRVAYGEGMTWRTAVSGETLTVLTLP